MSRTWLATPTELSSLLMNQLLLPQGLTTWPPRVLPSMPLWHLAQDQLAQLPPLVQLPMLWAMLAQPQLDP